MLIHNFIASVLKTAGKIACKGFSKNKSVTVKQKGDQSNILTDTDLAVGKHIVKKIQDKFPDDSIIDEEMGYLEKNDSVVWIIDPIDGTSNFASGNPWFAIMLARLEKWQPMAAGIYLPTNDELYYAQANKGADLNGKKVQVTNERYLKNILVSYGIDFTPDLQKTRREVKIIEILVQKTRNVRASGCSGLDGAYVASSKFGACLVQSSKIWDNAPLSLIVQEAGGCYSDIYGNKNDFNSTQDNFKRNYTYLAASPVLHKQIVSLINENN